MVPFPRSHPARLIITHFMAIVAGYATWNVMGWESLLAAKRGENAPMKSMRVGRDRGTDPRKEVGDPQEQALQRGRELLSLIHGNHKPPQGVAERQDYRMEPEDLAALADKLEPEADPRSAVVRLTARCKGKEVRKGDIHELQARYLQWLRSDTPAALAFLAAEEEAGNGIQVLLPDFSRFSRSKEALAALLQERGWKAILEHAEKPEFRILREPVLKEFARQGDASRISELAVLPGWDESSAIGDFAWYWPLEKIDEYLRLVEPGKEAEALMKLVRDRGDNATAWLKERLSSPEKGQETLKLLAEDYDFREMARRQPDWPLALRLQAMADFSPPEAGTAPDAAHRIGNSPHKAGCGRSIGRG